MATTVLCQYFEFEKKVDRWLHNDILFKRGEYDKMTKGLGKNISMLRIADIGKPLEFTALALAKIAMSPIWGFFTLVGEGCSHYGDCRANDEYGRIISFFSAVVHGSTSTVKEIAGEFKRLLHNGLLLLLNIPLSPIIAVILLKDLCLAIRRDFVK